MTNTKKEALTKLNQLKLRQLMSQSIHESFPFVKDEWVLRHESLDNAKWECFLSKNKEEKLLVEITKPDGEFLGYNLNCELSSSLESPNNFVILSYVKAHKVTSYSEIRFYIRQCLKRGECEMNEIKNRISNYHDDIFDKI